MVPIDQAPAGLKRRTFFSRAITLAGVASLIPSFLRGTGKNPPAPPAGGKDRIQVKSHPLAVPRTSKGSTRNG